MPYFNPDAATDAVALLVRFAGGRLHKVAVLKLLYFAERQAIAEGSMITRATFYSMPRGPVATEVLDLINGNRTHARWSECLRTDDNIVSRIRPPGPAHLSRNDINLLRHHWLQHRDSIDPLAFPTALVEYSHTFPEWRDPSIDGQLPISYEDILRAHNLTEDRIARILALHAETWSWISCWGKPA